MVKKEDDIWSAPEMFSNSTTVQTYLIGYAKTPLLNRRRAYQGIGFSNAVILYDGLTSAAALDWEGWLWKQTRLSDGRTNIYKKADKRMHE